MFSHFNYFLTRVNRQRVRDLRTEAVHCRDLSRVKNQKVKEGGEIGEDELRLVSGGGEGERIQADA